jgi:hypothetical protein
MSYVRCAIIGTIAGGEVWSVNPVFDPNGEFEGPVNQAALETAAKAISQLSPGVNLMQQLSPELKITQCRLEVRADADDSLLALAIGTATTAQVGTGTLRLPPQAAMVISLRTDVPGASGRGRLYWPATAGAVTSTFHVSAAVPGVLAADAATWLHAIEGILATNFPLIGFDLAVRSAKTKTTPHVVRLQVGDVIDTQRRRRDNIPEAYATVAF